MGSSEGEARSSVAHYVLHLQAIDEFWSLERLQTYVTLSVMTLSVRSMDSFAMIVGPSAVGNP